MITDEQLDSLSDEPDLAFIQLEKILRENTQKLVEMADNEGEDGTDYYNNYLNEAIGAAKVFNIPRLSQWPTPEIGISPYPNYKSFISAVDHYVMQVRLVNRMRSKKFSVPLDSGAKQKIHRYITKIKEIIEASDLEERKKNALYDDLNTFAKQIDRSRTPLESFGLVLADFCGVVGKGAEKLKPAKEFIDSIGQILGYAKTQENSLPRLEYIRQKRLEAPVDKESEEAE